MKKLLFIMVLLALPSLASANDYYFKEISTHATVLPNSDILVQENYTYSFEGSFTYVYRSFYLDQIESVEEFSVRNAATGEPYSPSASYEGDEVSYRWTISAADEEQTYVMEYRFISAIKENDDATDYLWYSILPADREKMVETVKFRITFPQETGTSIVSRVSRTSNITQEGDNTILFTASDIEPYGAFDAEFYLPEGMVEIYVTPSQSASQAFMVFTVAYVLLVFFAFVFFAVREYTQHGRDPVVTGMKAVRNLRPALAGLVVDEKADIKEIEATILDLAIRGYIYIREEEKGTLFSRTEIWLMKTKEPAGLMDYEARVMRAIFGDGEKVNVSSLKNKFYKHTPGILKSIHSEAETHKIFDRSVEKTISSYAGKFIIFPVALMALLILSVMAFTAMGFRLLSAAGIGIGLSILSMVVMFPMSIAFAFAMPRKTVEGVIHAGKYADLRDWMVRYPLKEGRLFDEYLPYSTAFGVQDVWVKKLKDIEGYKSNWYSGPYTAAGFSHLHRSLGSSFAAPGGGSHGGGGFGGGGGAGGGGAGAG